MCMSVCGVTLCGRWMVFSITLATIFKTGFLILALAVLDQVGLRLIYPACLCFPSAGIKGVYHQYLAIVCCYFRTVILLLLWIANVSDGLR